jgi:transportin-3
MYLGILIRSPRARKQRSDHFSLRSDLGKYPPQLPFFRSRGQDMAEQLPPNSNNVEEEYHRVFLALQTVFSASKTSSNEWWSQRHLADRYLTSFQGTTTAWMVCDRFLQEDDVVNAEVNLKMEQAQRRFFAAQTLHTKCRNDFHQLPKDSLPMLRDSLLNHLHRYVKGIPNPSDEALIARLAMCISAFAVQVEWTTIVSDLLNFKGGSLSSRMVATIVLRALPEECASDRLFMVDDAPRFKMRDHLISSAPLAFSFLQDSLQNSEHASRVLKTLHIWVRYVPIRPESLVESPLLPWTAQAMTQPEYLESAADVLVEVLRMYPSHHYGNEGLVKRMIPFLSNLPLSAALHSGDEDVMRAYCRVITEMGESYMSLILFSHQRPPQPLHRNESTQLVEAVLMCSNIPDAEIAGITLYFWYRLVSEMENIEPYDWRQTIVDTYAPILLQLVQICISSLMRYPDDFDEVAEDIVEDLQRHRQYVEETIEDCCRLLGERGPLQLLNRLLHEEIQRVVGRQDIEWLGLESCLACLGAMHRFVPSDEPDILPFCFSLIPQLPSGIRPLRYTACKVIGRYSSWLTFHPEYLQSLLPYLAQSLSDPECSPAAALAIKELCTRSNQNVSVVEPVLQLYEELTTHPGRINVKDEIHILEGACQALSRVVQDSGCDGRQFLSRIVTPIGNRLVSLVHDLSASSKRILPEIERLTAIVRFLILPFVPPKTHPMVELLQSIWSLLDESVNRYPTDFTLCEAICRLHKHTIRTVGAKAYAPMLEYLMNQLTGCFAKSHQSSFLYGASICITDFGPDKAYSVKLFEMIATMADTFFSFNRDVNELTSHPDVAEEFFYLIGRMISYCPDPLVQSPLLEAVILCAVGGMQLDHHGANRGVLKFLETTISYGVELHDQDKPISQSAVGHVFAKHGQAITLNLTRALVGELPLHSDQVGDILWKLSILHPIGFKQWLSATITSINSAPDRAKAELMTIVDTKLDRDEFGLIVRSFETACGRERRYRRTQSQQ